MKKPEHDEEEEILCKLVTYTPFWNTHKNRAHLIWTLLDDLFTFYLGFRPSQYGYSYCNQCQGSTILVNQSEFVMNFISTVSITNSLRLYTRVPKVFSLVFDTLTQLMNKQPTSKFGFKPS